jgi:hypothetical protein
MKVAAVQTSVSRTGSAATDNHRRYSRLAVTSLLWAVACVMGLAACSKTTQLTEHERVMLLTESDFASFGMEHYEREPNGTYEKMHSYLDRSVDYSYEYEDPDGAFYILSTVTDDSSNASARVTETAQKVGILIGLKAGGVVEKPLKLARTYGSKATLTLLMHKDQPVGNVFSAVMEDKVLLIMFTGVYFDAAEEFDELISSQAEAVERFKG